MVPLISVSFLLVAQSADYSITTSLGVHHVRGDLPSAFDALSSDSRYGCSDRDRGCRVEIWPGDYTLTRPIGICGRFHVSAQGASICSQTDVSGLIFRAIQEDGCRSENSTWVGGRFSACTGTYVGSSTSAAPLPVGVDIRAPLVRVQGVQVVGYARGIQAICSDDAAADKALGFEAIDGAFCNQVRLVDVEVSANWLDGVYFFGRDANAGYTLSAEVSNNCRRAHDLVGAPEHVDSYQSGGRCGNIRDESFLGNAHYSMHSAFAIDTVSTSTDGNVRYYQLAVGNANGRNTVVAPYFENLHAAGANPARSGNGNCELNGYGNWMLGGINGIRCKTFGGATILGRDGNVTGGMRFRSGVDVAGVGLIDATLILGESVSSNSSGSPFAIDYQWPESVSDAERRVIRLRPRSSGDLWLELSNSVRWLDVTTEDRIQLRLPVDSAPE